MATATKRNFENVVVVADMLPAEADAAWPLHLRRDLEQTDAATLSALAAAIRSLGHGLVNYEGPDDLALNADSHAADIVLSLYGGSRSRSRMALVPAVCETFGLRFIGPDAYGRIIAQDKEVSKRLALDCGVRTPAWRVIRADADMARLSALRYPCVLKPLLEGSSIGIAQDNLVRSSEEAWKIWVRLRDNLGQPVLVEEFVRGREVSLCAIEQGGEIAWAYSEMLLAGDPDYFSGRLFDAGEKQNRTPGRTVRNIDDILSAADQVAIERLLKAFGRFGYCRVDGRHDATGFSFLELTPDAWIHPLGQFAMAFTEKDWSYADVIAAVLSSAD